MTRQPSANIRIFVTSVLFLAVLTVVIALAAPAQQAGEDQPSAKSPTAAAVAEQARILDSYGNLPLSFEANHGQTDARVKFLSRTGGYSLFLTADEAVLTFRGTKEHTDKVKLEDATTGAVLRMRLHGANAIGNVTGLDQLPGTSNYFIGNDPAKWRTSVPTFGKVKYERIYPGVDLVYYGNERQLEYDFIVAPGADPRRIAFDVRGARNVLRDSEGNLLLRMKQGEIRWRRPIAYQEENGARQQIAARYAITRSHRVRFELGNYDASRPLYIDPLVYSTYLGGSGNDYGSGIALDSSGNAYLVGSTGSANFPVTEGALQTAPQGAFITKINPSGSALVYSTYLGGTTCCGTFANRVALDGAGNAYVIGGTSDTDFPTVNPVQSANGGGIDAFVAKISPSGSALVYSTYLGGSGQDIGSGIAVDGSGNAYATGQTLSSNFPITPGAFQSVCGNGHFCWDAFVAKIDPSGSALSYSTYLGGNGFTDAFAGDIAVDSGGNAYITGDTTAVDFPTKNPLQANDKETNPSESTGYVTKFNRSGSALVYSTYLGGSSEDLPSAIVVDAAGNAYLTGSTLSTDFPTMNPIQSTNKGGYDAFVTKINSTGSALVYSTYLGGVNDDSGNGIAVDITGSAYITGSTFSNNFPITPRAFQTQCNGRGYYYCFQYGDAFVTRISPSGSALVYSTYLGGRSRDGGSTIKADSAGNAYVVGSTDSTDFPTMNPLQPVNGGLSDVFVTKMLVAAPTTATLSSSPNPSSRAEAVTFTAVVSSSIGAPPDGETVTFMDGTMLLGTATLSAGSTTLTTSTLPLGTHLVTARYSGDSTFATSISHAVKQTVRLAPTSTTLTSSRDPSIYGENVILAAAIATSGSVPPTGNVNFIWNGYIVAAAILNASGVATVSKANLDAYTYPLIAKYSGDTNNAPSASAVLDQVIAQATSAAKLTSSPNPSTKGQAVTFIATITSPTVVPTGPVTFTSGTTMLGMAQLSGGKATFTTSTLAVGLTTVKATYNGDSNIAESSASVTQTVQP